jgi:hypothetical protein
MKSKYFPGFRTVSSSLNPLPLPLLTKVELGFAVVGQYDDPKIKAAQELAFDQMLSWLKKH